MTDDTDWLKIGRAYIEFNAAESGADVVIEGLCDEVARLRRVVQMVRDEYYGDDSSGDWQSIAREARAALDVSQTPIWRP